MLDPLPRPEVQRRLKDRVLGEVCQTCGLSELTVRTGTWRYRPCDKCPDLIKELCQ